MNMCGDLTLWMPEPNNTDSKIFEQSGYGQFVCFYKQIYLWIHRMNVSQWGGGGGGVLSLFLHT